MTKITSLYPYDGSINPFFLVLKEKIFLNGDILITEHGKELRVLKKSEKKLAAIVLEVRYIDWGNGKQTSRAIGWRYLVQVTDGIPVAKNRLMIGTKVYKLK